jgi:hypothetical protein
MMEAFRCWWSLIKAIRLQLMVDCSPKTVLQMSRKASGCLLNVREALTLQVQCEGNSRTMRDM